MSDNNKKNILIAETSDDFRAKLSDCLKEWGLSVSITDNGQDAWDKLKKQTFDVVFLNAVLPGILGIEIIEKVRDKPEMNDLSVILIGAHHQAERYHANPTELYGADGYIENIDTEYQILEEINRVSDFELKQREIESATQEGEDRKKRAVRVAEKVLREIISEYPDKARKGIKKGSFYEILDEQIMKAKIKYNKIMSNNNSDDGKDHFFSTLNAFLRMKRLELKEKELLDNAQ